MFKTHNNQVCIFIIYKSVLISAILTEYCLLHSKPYFNNVNIFDFIHLNVNRLSLIWIVLNIVI